MKLQRPRPGPGARPPRRRFIRSQPRRRRIQSVDMDRIETQVIDQQKPVVRRHRHAMCMRRRLSLRIWAMPAVLKKRNRRTQPTVRANRKRSRASSTIVRRKRGPPSVVEGHMTSSSAKGRDLIDLRQPRTCPVERITRYAPATPALVRIQLISNHDGPTIRGYCQKRRIVRLRSQPERLQLPGVRLKRVRINALAGSSGLRSDQQQLTATGSLSLR